MVGAQLQACLAAGGEGRGLCGRLLLSARGELAAAEVRAGQGDQGSSPQPLETRPLPQQLPEKAADSEEAIRFLSLLFGIK